MSNLHRTNYESNTLTDGYFAIFLLLHLTNKAFRKDKYIIVYIE